MNLLLGNLYTPESLCLHAYVTCYKKKDHLRFFFFFPIHSTRGKWKRKTGTESGKLKTGNGRQIAHAVNRICACSNDNTNGPL